MHFINQLKIYRYRVSIQVLQSSYLPRFLGATLHGAMGHWLKKLKCKRIDPYSDICNRNCICNYQLIMDNALNNPEHPLAHTLSKPPNPYIMDAFTPAPIFIKAKVQYSFVLSLIGSANELLLDAIVALTMAGIEGIGGRRNKHYLLQNVVALQPDGSEIMVYDNVSDLQQFELLLQQTTAVNPSVQEVKAQSKTQLQVPSNLVPFTIQNALQSIKAKQLNPQNLTLHFKSPLRIISRKEVLIRGYQLPFNLLFRLLYNRAANLALLYGGANEATFLSEQNEAANNIQHQWDMLQWKDMRHWSNLKKNWEKMGGLLGSINFKGDFKEYLPLLILGQYIHIGKSTSFGLGKYTLDYEAAQQQTEQAEEQPKQAV